MNDKYYRIAKVVIAMLLLIVLYLFALNGRYTFNQGARLDKWTSTVEGIKHKK